MMCLGGRVRVCCPNREKFTRVIFDMHTAVESSPNVSSAIQILGHSLHQIESCRYKVTWASSAHMRKPMRNVCVHNVEMRNRVLHSPGP